MFNLHAGLSYYPFFSSDNSTPFQNTAPLLSAELNLPHGIGNCCCSRKRKIVEESSSAAATKKTKNEVSLIASQTLEKESDFSSKLRSLLSANEHQIFRINKVFIHEVYINKDFLKTIELTIKLHCLDGTGYKTAAGWIAKRVLELNIPCPKPKYDDNQAINDFNTLVEFSRLPTFKVIKQCIRTEEGSFRYHYREMSYNPVAMNNPLLGTFIKDSPKTLGSYTCKRYMADAIFSLGEKSPVNRWKCPKFIASTFLKSLRKYSPVNSSRIATVLEASIINNEDIQPSALVALLSLLIGKEGLASSNLNLYIPYGGLGGIFTGALADSRISTITLAEPHEYLFQGCRQLARTLASPSKTTYLYHQPPYNLANTQFPKEPFDLVFAACSCLLCSKEGETFGMDETLLKAFETAYEHTRNGGFFLVSFSKRGFYHQNKKTTPAQLIIDDLLAKKLQMRYIGAVGAHSTLAQNRGGTEALWIFQKWEQPYLQPIASLEEENRPGEADNFKNQLLQETPFVPLNFVPTVNQQEADSAADEEWVAQLLS